MTGIPSGVVDGFQNFTGPVQADLLRLNVAIPPSDAPNNLGLVAGDAAGFPNGRRIDDDVVTIELRAIAGLTIPLVDPSYTPDGAASAVQDGTTNTNAGLHRHVPVPRPSRRRLPDGARDDGGVVIATPWRTRTPGRARSCSTSAAMSGRSWSPCRGPCSARRSRSGPSTGRVTSGTRTTTTTGMCRTSRSSTDPSWSGHLPSLVFPEVVEGGYALCLKGSTEVAARARGHRWER